MQALSIEANAADIEVSELGIDQNDECTGTFDSSFERPFGMGSWTHVAPATRLVDGDPHSGDYAWRVQTGLVGIITLVQFPGYGDPGQRPTMSGWMRVEGTSMRGTIEVRVADLILPAFTTVATSWGAKRIACLGEEWAGQPGFVMIGAIAQSTGSGTSPTPTLWVDDLGPDLQPVSNCD